MSLNNYPKFKKLLNQGWQPIETAPKDGSLFLGIWIQNIYVYSTERPKRLKEQKKIYCLARWCSDQFISEWETEIETYKEGFYEKGSSDKYEEYYHTRKFSHWKPITTPEEDAKTQQKIKKLIEVVAVFMEDYDPDFLGVTIPSAKVYKFYKWLQSIGKGIEKAKALGGE